MKINLSKDVTIDLDKAIESRIIFQANSGGGKSWAARRFIEQTFGKKQLIVIDPEGEFGNMRAEFDFVYIAKDGGDAVAEVRSAALLARRLLETKANAIIDIYELGSQRSAFVKAFFEACVNMPKNLWQDCFFLLDEAHKFAPEKGQGESIALQSVIDMASLGRKRGYCLIPMTQRPAKLSKDVVAECNNKLIGRASLDIDRKRSAEELGFSSKEEILSLRDLQPGEFYAFGPAISREVVKTQVGDVKVKPPKRGTRAMRVAPPTAKVKKLLAELADLPQEAEKELKTLAEIKEALNTARREIVELKRKPADADPRAIERAVKVATDQLVREKDRKGKEDAEKYNKVIRALEQIAKLAQPFVGKLEVYVGEPLVINTKNIVPIMREIKRKMPTQAPSFLEIPADMLPLGAGEMRLLKILVQRSPMKMTRAQLALFAGIKSSTGTFKNYISKLKTSGMIEIDGDLLTASQAGFDASGETPSAPASFDEVIAMWRESLPTVPGKILDIIVEANDWISREAIAERLQILSTTGTFKNYISILRTNNLIDVEGQNVKLSDKVAGF